MRLGGAVDELAFANAHLERCMEVTDDVVYAVCLVVHPFLVMSLCSCVWRKRWMLAVMLESRRESQRCAFGTLRPPAHG